MNWITIKDVGLDDTLEALSEIPSVIERSGLVAETAKKFEGRLRAATPTGYSGRLRESVLGEESDGKSLVGYDRAVETAGNPRLDSVVRPETEGKSVLRWTHVGELEAVLQETVAAFSSEGISTMKSIFARQIDGGT